MKLYNLDNKTLLEISNFCYNSIETIQTTNEPKYMFICNMVMSSNLPKEIKKLFYTDIDKILDKYQSGTFAGVVSKMRPTLMGDYINQVKEGNKYRIRFLLKIAQQADSLLLKRNSLLLKKGVLK